MSKIKLDQNDVKAIKVLITHTDLIDRQIAKIFGVSRKHINSIRNGKRWNYDYGKETTTAQIETIERYLKNY